MRTQLSRPRKRRLVTVLEYSSAQIVVDVLIDAASACC